MPAALKLPQDVTFTERAFTNGIVRDTARHAIPPGGVYNAVDYLFDRPGVAYKRGGTAFQSSELTDETILVAVAAPEFPGDPRVVVIGSDGTDRTLYDVTGDTAESGVDINGAQPTENPPLYVDKLIVTDGLDAESDGFYVPQKVYLDTGAVAVADLGGSPPNARCSCVHLSYLVLANGTDPNDGDAYRPNRLWFSPIPDIEETWDTATAYIDVPSPITGLASIQGMLIVFTRGTAWRILGNVPPGTTGENMELQPIGAMGCIDARSIVTMNGLVYFANENGVFYTNGAAPQSITHKNGGSIGVLWEAAVDGYAPALGAVVCAGAWRNQFLFITVRHADDDPQTGARYQFLYHAPSGAWTTLADGVTADMYATRFAPNGEIYAACGDASDPVRLLRLSPLFDPSSTNSADANGEDVEPLLELRPFAASPSLKAFGFGHATVAVDSGAGMVVTRKRFDTGGDAEAMTVRIEQVGASSQTEIVAVEMDVRGYDVDSEAA